MKIAKTRNVKTPTRGTSKSAGIDFYIPNDFKSLSLKPNDSIVIPSGIKACIPEGYALIAFNKSGIATKKNLQVGACVVDEDYQGEIHIHLTNVGLQVQKINAGDKIVQFLLIPVALNELNLVEEKDLFNSTTERGEGKFGSTGNK